MDSGTGEKTMTKKFGLLAAAALVATLAANPAQATVTVYTNLAAFNAALAASGTDTFNNLAPGVALPTSLTRTAGAFGYTVSSAQTATSSLYGAGSSSDAWLSNNLNSDAIVFNAFTAGTSAIGANFFGSDINGAFVAAPLGLTVTVTDASGTVTQTLISPTTSTFLGFTSTGGLSQLTVAATVPTSSYWATVNNLTLGRISVTPTVPEPATWAMMLVGFGMIGATARYRRRKTALTFA